MKSTKISLPEIKIIGLKVRTNNLLEANLDTASIGKTINNYFQNGLFNQIPNRKNPGISFSIYTNYESDYTGNYDYFFGEEVDSFENIPDIFSKITINSQHYTKFNIGPGSMPKICVNAWQRIWQMSDQELGGKRSYHADFEIYDSRAADPQNSVFDIYIGIRE